MCVRDDDVRVRHDVHPREYERFAANMGDMGCERSERPIFS